MGVNIVVILVRIACKIHFLTSRAFLMSVHELETLFHEFGHALHGVLSCVRFQHISGSRVPMDFMETPSQFMENFCYSFPVLSTFAKHHETGMKGLIAFLLFWNLYCVCE